MPNGKVIYLADYRDHELVRVCRAIKRRVEHGRAKGMLFVLFDERGGFEIGAAGKYCADPRLALNVSAALVNALKGESAANGG